MGLVSEHLEMNVVSSVTLLPQVGGAESTYHTSFLHWLGFFVCL